MIFVAVLPLIRPSGTFSPRGEGVLLPFQATQNPANQCPADLCRDCTRHALHRCFHDRLALIAGTAAACGFVIVAAEAGERPAAAGASAVRFCSILLCSLAGTGGEDF